MADEEDNRSSSSLESLPEECIAHIISLTSPRDACSFSMASSTVRAAADSDYVWERFLPLDYREILLTSSSSAAEASQFAGKKELFERLSSSSMIDGGTKTFSIDIRTSKKRYMVGARGLSITWGNNPLCWCWKPISFSRFPEGVELIMVSWLEIQAKISKKTLSPNTTYGAYLVVQVTSRAFGLSKVPFEAAVQVGEAQMKNKKMISMENAACGPGRWLEIELGEFYNDGGGGGGGEDCVRVSFRETKGEHLKGGIVVEGIDLKPKG